MVNFWVLFLVVVMIQLIMAIVHITNFGVMAGKYKLILVCVLSLVTGIIVLRIEGLSWEECLVHSTTLGGMQVFFHQVWKQFTKEKN